MAKERRMQQHFANRTVTDAVLLAPAHRRYLVLADDLGTDVASKWIAILERRGVSLDYHVHSSQSDSATILSVLSLGTVDTILCVAGRWRFLWAVEDVAYACAWDGSRCLYTPCDDMPFQVFCVHCYSVRVFGHAFLPEVTCPDCGNRLEVAEHYSHRWRAYMGTVKPLREKRRGECGQSG